MPDAPTWTVLTVPNAAATIHCMGDPAKRRASYADLLAVPPNLVGEIVLGELITHPRPASRHALASSNLGGALYAPFQRGRGGPGGWSILDEPELHLQEDVLVPDLAGWRRERMSEMPDVAAFTLQPDWVCEVLSPSTAGIDRVEKVKVYAREGVTHVWMIDPIARTLEVFRLLGQTYAVMTTARDDAVIRAEPFEAVPLALAELWE